MTRLADASTVVVSVALSEAPLLPWAVIVALFTFLWFQDWRIGGIIGAAMIINLVVAATAGFSIPLILKKIHVDPALAGGVVLTTVTDVVGYMAFLGLGAIFLL